MVAIRGQRESRGATAAELDPLQAALVTLLRHETSDRTIHAVQNGEMDSPQPGATIDATSAGYVKGGPRPFVCGACSHFHGGGVCDLVDGPYEGGRVDADDACIYWRPGTVLMAMDDAADNSDDAADNSEYEPPRPDDAGDEEPT